jgi:small-conductance mechanosensitive channel
MQLLELLRENEVARDAALSLTWVAFVLAARWAAARVVRRAAWSSERAHLRWTMQVRSGAVLLIFVGLLLIWGTELRTMALSLTALAVALVIATKEMLLCIMGSLLRASTRSYTVGDRIEMGGARGDVIEYGLFATTILEIGPGHMWTGRAVTVPNSVLLSERVVNETFATDYVLHIICVPITDEALHAGADDALCAAGKAACAEYIDEARAHVTDHARDHGFEAPPVEPTVSVRIPEAGKVDLLLRLPTPVRDKGIIEQKVLRRWLDAMR